MDEFEPFVLMAAMLLVGAYVLGSIPFGLLVARLFGVKDVRRTGSGNIGATNVLRSAGKIAGALTLALDMLKGALPPAVAQFWFHADSPVVAATALAVFLGHCYPIFLKFRGGKGVATGLGAHLGWLPAVGMLLVAAWLLIARFSRISSLAALTAFALLPLFCWQLGPPLSLYTGVMFLAVVFWKHRENIRRIIAGTESRIGTASRESGA
ncbi:MAG: glycerol-3-phosphate 1-O-acyltransferase PlsY [Magnetococcus sp. WYHC-3]